MSDTRERKWKEGCASLLDERRVALLLGVEREHERTKVIVPIEDDKGPVVVDNAFVQAPRIAPDDGCEWPLLDRVGSASSSRLSKRTNRGKSKQSFVSKPQAGRERLHVLT